MPSNIRPSTRAVSAMLSFLPICEPFGSRYTACIPKSAAATSNAHRVRVLVFSKISATFFPAHSACGTPAFFRAFNSAAKSSSSVISAGVKSSSFKKFRFFNDIFDSPHSAQACRRISAASFNTFHGIFSAGSSRTFVLAVRQSTPLLKQLRTTSAAGFAV